ncbi:MAG: sulfur carrier protein ThiS [Nitrospiraceae bacterium]
MIVIINGKSEDIQATVILDVLKAKNLDPRMVAVELNDTMIERDQLSSTSVTDGDRVEFLFYMGGGQ